MTKDISIIRQAGFFKKYETLTDVQLLDALYDVQKEAYAKQFSKEEFYKKFRIQTDTDRQLLDTLYEQQKAEYQKYSGDAYLLPKRMTDICTIIEQDSEKCLRVDPDVIIDCNAYVLLLQDFSKASNGHFLPSDMEEIWSSEEGPITVRFILNGQTTAIELEYSDDDYFDESIIRWVNEKMKKVSDDQFYYCLGPNDEWVGTGLTYIRVTEDERKLLIDELGWTFYNEDKPYLGPTGL
jgi:hypothetical protein